MDETEFNDKYWHSNTKLVTVINPRTEDYIFQATIETGLDVTTGRMKSEARHYRVPAGGTEKFPGPIANMYLDQMSKLVAQDDEKIQFMIDYALKAQYYDDLTVSIEDLIHDYTPQKEYLNGAVDDKAEEPEQAFAGASAPAPKKLGRPPKSGGETYIPDALKV